MSAPATTPGSTTIPTAPTAPITMPAPASPQTAGPFDGLSVELRDEPSITKYKSVEELARGHLETVKLVGAKGIIPPGKDATPEQVAAFHEALGTPKDATGYSIAKSFKPPEGLPWNPELLPGLLPVFKEAGITDAQASKIVEAYAKSQDEAYRGAMTEIDNAKAAADTALRREWGRAYDAKMDVAQRAYKAIAGKNAEEAGALMLADGTPLAEHPLMKRMFAAIGEAQGEAPLIGDASRRMTMTPEEASRELLKLETEPESKKILLDNMHPEHAALMARRSALHKAKTAGG